MNSDFVITLMTWVLGAYVIVTMAGIIWAAKTIINLRQQVRRLRRPGQVPRDANGRPLKERK